MPSFEHHRQTLLPLREVFGAHGHELRFVGGCVRDWILGLKIQDVDLATTFPANQAYTTLQKAGFKVVPTGMDHGTLTVVINHFPYEITTLRRDISTDGRRATICYTDDWQEDAARRDFTFNALYRSFEGELFDYFGGQNDLENGVVRFIGDPVSRVCEDYLRILRLFRFYARYGRQEIAQDTLAVCREYAHFLKNLSIERITHEMSLILETYDCYQSIELMERCQILSTLFDQVDLDRFKQFLGKESQLYTPPYRKGSSFIRRLAALTDNHKALRLSNVQKKNLKHFDSLKAFQFESLSDYNLYCYLYGSTVVADFLLIHTQTSLEDIQKILQIEIPDFPINGEDVFQLGVPKGSRIKKYLDGTLSWWAKRGFHDTKEACIIYLKSLVDQDAPN